MNRNALVAVLVAIGIVLAGCSGSPDESSVRAAVAEIRDGEFMRSGSVGRFRIDTVSVEAECAVVEIIELPQRNEMSIFLRWDSRRWVLTNIATGHDFALDVTANDCRRS